MQRADNRKKRKKGIETSHRILESAADLFARHGYDRVSVQAIAAAAGIKEGSFYNHYASKAALLTALFHDFTEMKIDLRPADADIDNLLRYMQPEEILKNILFYFGSHVSNYLENIAMIINQEKYHNTQAAGMYYEQVVQEPAGYYERLFSKMAACGLIRQIDAQLFAMQYNYVTIALTKEYFMAKSGQTDLHAVIRYMVKTIAFFCDQMKK